MILDNYQYNFESSYAHISQIIFLKYTHNVPIFDKMCTTHSLQALNWNKILGTSNTVSSSVNPLGLLVFPFVLFFNILSILFFNSVLVVCFIILQSFV